MRILTLILILAAAIPGVADSLYIRLENDLWGDSDRHYTHGTRVHYVDNREKFDVVYGFGQYIYTPSDISVSELQVDDRPYGAWLYGLIACSRTKGNILDYLELQAGTTGPHAHGDTVQTAIHEWTDSTMPQGWEHQIKNEIGINLHYYRKYRTLLYGDQVDYISQTGGSLGNIYTGAYFGGTLRLGYHLPSDFGTGLIEPGVTKMDTSSRPAWTRSHIFGQLGGRAVFRNIFLDGNTFQDSHSVEREDMVGEATAGFKLYAWKVSLMMGFTWRSKEFTTQQEANQFATAVVETYF